MGTPEFAAHHLKVLHNNGANIVATITAPDKPAGRGRKLKPSAVKITAMELGIPILQPEKLKNEEFIKELQSYKPDLQIVVAFRMLPEVVWSLPPKGTFNLHASLLPQYRGAAPINWAIINGEKETGVTTFFLNHDIDTGNIIMQEKIQIEDSDNAGDLHDKLMKSGASLVVKTLDAIAKGTVKDKPQKNNNKDTLKPAPKIFKEDCRLNWNETALNIYNKTRGLSPYPGAWTQLHQPGKDAISAKVFAIEIQKEKTSLKPGEVYCDNKSILSVGTKDYTIFIKEIQLAGKKRMKTEDLLRGLNWQNDTRLI